VPAKASASEEELQMDALKRLQPRDWTIAIVAFVLGAIIF
jgi:hypothetical protein